jgi:hypothetical protein
VTYALGAKLIPGQENLLVPFIPGPQKLIEQGLPYAPYIEHGSWVTGQPDIARYGRDPYRGIAGLGVDPDQLQQQSSEAVAEARQVMREKLPMVTLATTGVLAGLAGGLAGSLISKSFLGTIVGGVAGGFVGYSIGQVVQRVANEGPQQGADGLAGVLAVL